MAAICSTCKRPIRWALTEEGRRIPLDPEPERRMVVLGQRKDPTGGGGLIDQVGSRPTFVTHFATCPNADQHRKTRR